MGKQKNYDEIKEKNRKKYVNFFNEILNNKDKSNLIYETLFDLSRPKIENMSKVLWKVRYLKYPHTKGRKLGNKSKAMPDSIFKKVLEHFKLYDDEMALAIEVEGVEGPRINDTLSIKLEHIDFETHDLHVYNHKGSHWYKVPMSIQIEEDLKKYIAKHIEEIKKHDNYIFYTKDDKHHPYRKYNHIEQHYVNRKLKAYLDEVGENIIYSYRDNDNAPLHQYTTHSNRAHAATQAKIKSNGDMKVVQQLLDHSPRSLSTTMLYIEDEEDKLKEIMRN